MRTAVALTLVLAVAAGAPAQDVPLKWSLKEGDLFYVKSIQNMDMSIGVLGMNQDQKQEASTVTRFRVKSVAPGATVVEMTMVEFKMDAAGVPGLGGAADKMKGLSFTATLDDKLKVTKLDGYDKFLEAISGDSAETKAMMKMVMPEGTFRQMVSQTFAIVPNKAVKVGDTWSSDDKLSMGPLGDFVLKQSFKLASVSGSDAKITSKAELTFKPGDGGGAIPFKITKADMKAEKYDTTYTFDTKTGRLKDSLTDAIMGGTMTASAGGMEIEMSMKMKMKQKTEVTEKNPVKD